MKPFILQIVQYKPDHVHIEKIIQEIDLGNEMDAFQMMENFLNCVLIYDKKIIAKKSAGFNPLRIKQFCLAKVCDRLRIGHLFYSDLNISKETDRTFNELIYRILLEERELYDAQILAPIENELMEIVTTQKGEN